MVMKRIGKAKPDWAAQVENACVTSGLQLTRLRRQVLDIIATAPSPLGAYAIIDEMSRAQDKKVAPPTVYRTLEFFLEQGFLHKIESRNATLLANIWVTPTKEFLPICESCGRTDEVENARIGKPQRPPPRGTASQPNVRLLRLRGFVRLARMLRARRK